MLASLGTPTWLLLFAAGASCGPPNWPRVPTRPVPAAAGPVSVDGDVVGVDRQPPGAQLESGVRLTLQPGAGEPIVVELAPGWYLDQNEIGFERRERVSVRGTRPSAGGAVVAWEIRKAGRSLRLRDETGRPLW
jgi:hypothetical protein